MELESVVQTCQIPNIFDNSEKINLVLAQAMFWTISLFWQLTFWWKINFLFNKTWNVLFPKYYFKRIIMFFLLQINDFYTSLITWLNRILLYIQILVTTSQSHIIWFIQEFNYFGIDVYYCIIQYRTKVLYWYLSSYQFMWFDVEEVNAVIPW